MTFLVAKCEINVINVSISTEEFNILHKNPSLPPRFFSYAHFPIIYSISRNYRAGQPAAGDGIKTKIVNLIINNL